jgi:1,4-alpha-glucan branching enzyme
MGLFVNNSLNTNNFSCKKRNDKTAQNPIITATKVQEKTVYPSVANYNAYLIPKTKISFGRHLTEGTDNHLNYLGCNYTGNGKATFRVFAPDIKEMTVQISKEPTSLQYDDSTSPTNCIVHKMKKINNEVFEFIADSSEPDKTIQSGDMYRFELTKADGEKLYRKDPRTKWQSNGALGWSTVHDEKSYKWGAGETEWLNGTDKRRIIHTTSGPSKDLSIEQLNIGLLGGYEKAKKEIDNLALKGINSVQIMPIGEVFGIGNSGYDEVDKFAPKNSYGKPDEFKALIEHAHKKGINVILDVVPNHFGPVSNVVQDFGKAFDPDLNTPWGAGLNFEKSENKYMVNYMTDMMLNWAANYHIDGFRFDGCHELHSEPFLKELSCELRNHTESKNSIIIAEHLERSKKLTQPLSTEEKNNPEKVFNLSKSNPSMLNSFELDGQYNFDLKNTLIAYTSGWKQIYDCPKSMQDLEKEFKQGRTYYDSKPENLSIPKSKNVFNYLYGHDDSDAFGGCRYIPMLTTIKLGLVKEEKDLWKIDKTPFVKTQDLFKTYLQNPTEKEWIEKQKELGFKEIIQKEKFTEKYKEAQSLTRLATGTTFMTPSNIMFLMGDLNGELAPFQYIAEYPKDTVWDGIPAKQKLSDEKGYTVGKESFNESKPDQKEYNDPDLRQHIGNFTNELTKLRNSNKALNNNDSSKLKTFMYSNDIMHVHRWDNNGDEIIAVMNFGDKSFNKFELKDFPDGKWKEEINSNNTKFGGDGTNLNEKEKSISREDSVIGLPKQSIVIFKKIK